MSSCFLHIFPHFFHISPIFSSYFFIFPSDFFLIFLFFSSFFFRKNVQRDGCRFYEGGGGLANLISPGKQFGVSWSSLKTWSVSIILMHAVCISFVIQILVSQISLPPGSNFYTSKTDNSNELVWSHNDILKIRHVNSTSCDGHTASISFHGCRIVYIL